MSEHQRRFLALLRLAWIEEKPEGLVGILPAATVGLIHDMAIAPVEAAELVRAMQVYIHCRDITVLRSVEQGDWLAATVRYSSVRRDTGTPVTTTSQSMTCYRDGRFVESYNTFDVLSFFEALDLAPPNALALCLSGQRLR